MEVFNVLFIGNSGIGAKTCLISRITENVYPKFHICTIGFDSKTKIIKTNFGEIKMILIDTPGQENYNKITKHYFKSAHCIILGYAITDRKSFESIRYWYINIKTNVGDNPIIFLVANKIDIIDEREISEEEGISLANHLNIKYFGVSAKTGEGVDILLQDISDSLVHKFLSNKRDYKKLTNEDKKIKNKKNNKKKKEEKLETMEKKPFEIKFNENKNDDNNKKFKKTLNKFIDF